MGGEPILWPEAGLRRGAYDRLAGLIERHWETVPELPVAPKASDEDLDELLSGWEFATPMALDQLLDEVGDLLRDGIVHTSHPRYFGLFNPTPTFAGILADALVAAFNPQLAVASHAPAAVAIERRVLSFFGDCLGLPAAGGIFTSGGAEANMTGLLLALERHFPETAENGVSAAPGRPTVYVSPEAHHSFVKAARITGLGHGAVRQVEPSELRASVERDRADGRRPFLVVATAGSTTAGVIDPLPEIADVCRELGLDLHVDAAWAGAIALSERLRPLLAGIEHADSITVDAHKWLSAPMGAGMFLTPHTADLARTFRVTAGYMPTAETSDPYLTSAQWSRRFTGLKVFMSLAAAGRDGYASQIEHDCRLGEVLRDGLRARGWRIVNDTPLPVVCFVPGGPAGVTELTSIAREIEASGAAWISVGQLAGRPVLRACITSHRSTEEDVEALCEALDRARALSPGDPTARPHGSDTG